MRPMRLKLEDDSMCFCCGSENPIGLKLTFETTPEGRGFKDVVHGGLVATVLDEVMIRLLYLSGIEAVTAEMETRLIRPAHAGRAYRFEGWVVESKGRLVTTEAETLDAESGERVAWARAKCLRVRANSGSPTRASR